MTTTLNNIKASEPNIKSWERLLRSLGKTEADDEELPFAHILESTEFEDAIWCLQSVPNIDRELRLFATECIRQVQHLIPTEKEMNALITAENYAYGHGSKEELADAYEVPGFASHAANKSAYFAAYESARLSASEAASNATRDEEKWHELYAHQRKEQERLFAKFFC